jgi:O-antigen/teichoic acid export membrane protein
MVDYLFLKLNKFVPEKWKWVLDHDGFKKYFKNTGWMFFGQMFSLIASFFISTWLARYLGPKNYGIISYSIAFVGMFNFIAYLGIHSILSRDLVRYPEKKDELLGTSFFLLLTSSFVAFVFVVVSVFSFESSVFIRSLIILYASNFLWSALGVINIFFQSTVQAKKNVSVGIISCVAASILKIVLIITGKGIIWLILIFVFETLLNSMLYILIYKKSGFKFSAWRFNLKLAKDILSGAWLLSFAAAASFILVRVDQVMIRHFLGEVSVGLYAVALKLVEIWYFIPGIICTSFLPAIINAKKTSEEKYFSRLNKLYVLLSGIAVIIAIPLTIFASWLTNFLFGNAYIEAAGVLKIYVWSGVGLFLNVGFYQYFLLENRLKLIFYFYLFLMIINVVLNLILIPKLGLTGAAWATLISYSIGPIIVFGIKKFFNK